MLTTVRADIDLTALRRNLAVASELAGGARVLAVLKADAYGHGLTAAAAGLSADADAFAVARLDEALTLREAGIGNRLVLLGTLLDEGELRQCGQLDIDVVVHDPKTCARIRSLRGTHLRVWLKLDSGMHRLGLPPAAFAQAHRDLRDCPAVTQLLHMSHFASADEPDKPYTTQQLQCFEQLRRQLGAESVALSQANSAALIDRPESRADWVRPGIMLYGANPFGAGHPLALTAVMRLRANILALRDIPAGDPVGYGGDWVAPRPSRIATVGIGYGDGYPRHARNGTPVAVGEHIASLVGRVSMDSITVDVTGVPAVAIGDEVELWGTRVPVSEVARCAGTISYALLTGVTPRVPRRYHDARDATDSTADGAV